MLSSVLRREADGVWKAIFNHPFVVELFEGTLPMDKFKFYVLQDYNYLLGLMKALAIAAAKSSYEISRELLELAYMEASTEMKSYEELLKRLGLSLDDAMRASPTPTNVAYVNFLLAISYSGTPCQAIASFLPCFWSYADIAEVHRDKLGKNPVKVYVDWASVYLSPEYRGIVSRMRRLLDSKCTSDDAEKLKDIFVLGSKYEYMFWDAAYRMERWPI
ncbi:MAG: thiaminase II [Thermoprotei archaeon]|nr:MAG: thiaminase II [Thermoprotei archaeon]